MAGTQVQPHPARLTSVPQANPKVAVRPLLVQGKAGAADRL